MLAVSLTCDSRPVKAELFTTLGCHLCEDAHKLLIALQQSGMAIDIEPVEIADSDELVARYGIRIPVVKAADQELGWPFNIEQLATFLETAGKP